MPTSRLTTTADHDEAPPHCQRDGRRYAFTEIFARATVAGPHYAAAMSFTIPWILAVLTALGFGWMAWRAEKNWVLWVLGGGLFALVTSTIIFGLGHASTTPFSEQERSALQLEWTIISAVLILVTGWLLTLSLHRQHLLIWRLFVPETAAITAKPASGIENQPKPGATPKPAAETLPAKQAQDQRK